MWSRVRTNGGSSGDIIPSNSLKQPSRKAWERLPPQTLEKIFSYLNHIDRSRASTVCQNWAEAYDSPSLWKAPVFRFTKTQYSRGKFNPKHVVKRYGRFFRKLTIMHKRTGCQSQKFVAKQICDFLRVLTEEGIQVKSITMPRLMILAERCPGQFKCDRMTDFLKVQTALTEVDFTNGRTYSNPGMNVLESLVPENIQHLKLQNFFQAQFSGFVNTERYLSMISKFHGLRTLSLNYSYLSNQVMSCFSEHLAGYLEVFSILCKKCGSLSEVITNESWRTLTRKCPRMKVHFRLEIDDLRTTYVINSNVLSPAMPLATFQYSLRSRWNEEYDHPIFDYMTENFAASLSEVLFEMEGFDERDIRFGIAQLLLKCNQLENLKLRVHFPHFDMRDFFESVLDALYHQMLQNGCLSLKTIRTTFRGLWSDRRLTALSIQKEFTYRFNEIGIRLKLKIKK